MPPHSQFPDPRTRRQNCPGHVVTGSPGQGGWTGGKKGSERSGRSPGRSSQDRVPSGAREVRSAHVWRPRRWRVRRRVKLSSRGRPRVRGRRRGWGAGPSVGAPRLLPQTGVEGCGPMKSPRLGSRNWPPESSEARVRSPLTASAGRPPRCWSRFAMAHFLVFIWSESRGRPRPPCLELK